MTPETIQAVQVSDTQFVDCPVYGFSGFFGHDAGKMGMSTTEVGDDVADNIATL